ncbi:hypothetical protein H100_05012 [Trichophyton rubrum MR850]|nr:hypothetical protein H100_05012 [Trichophyton rubrum MR850]EZF62375.1 hypothetical protein H104_04993 [Trichophyton rubrum CBS 289.86]
MYALYAPGISGASTVPAEQTGYVNLHSDFSDVCNQPGDVYGGGSPHSKQTTCPCERVMRRKCSGNAAGSGTQREVGAVGLYLVTPYGDTHFKIWAAENDGHRFNEVHGISQG